MFMVIIMHLACHELSGALQVRSYHRPVVTMNAAVASTGSYPIAIGYA